jgi:hypothetical protein
VKHNCEDRLLQVVPYKIYSGKLVSVKDPDWIRIQLGLGDPDPVKEYSSGKAKIITKKEKNKKCKNFMVGCTE